LGAFGISAAATGKQRNLLGMFSLLAYTPWLAFNPLSLMNANKGALLLPIQSWKRILPSVVSASKSGAVSPIWSAMETSSA
jgi:hypothetical protein